MLSPLLAAVLLVPALLGADAARSPVARLAASVDPVTWRIDASHSELSFRIRHYVSRVRGTFGKWSGTVVADPSNLAAGSVEVTIDASTIDTNHEKRDSDLRSENFFDVAAHPTITFRSTKVDVKGTELTVHGDLTLRGITKPVVLTGTFIGVSRDGSRERIGFEARTTINRVDYGVTWNRALEGGGVMLGDQVEIEMVIGAVRQ